MNWLLIVLVLAAFASILWKCSKPLEINVPPQRPSVVLCGGGVREDFVPSNARNVGRGLATIVQLDELGLRSVFNSLVEQDKSIFDVSKFPQFRPSEPQRDATHALINVVLSRINAKADRRFVLLDLQSTKRDTSFDPADKALVDRYMINLFVQEKDERRVHAAAYNMSMTFIVKPVTGVLQIKELYFITNHFYNEPLVGGDNKFDRDFRLLNPFHLTQPWLTSDDRVLESDDQQIKLLQDHNHDLRSPKYRCFEDGVDESKAASQNECDANVGYWDKPVVNSSECPYYRANKNYVNRLGGLSPDGEFCEMPINTKRVGYRFTSADPQHKPHCYNCRIGADGNPGTIGPCCDEQQNKQLYPNLVSPDFAFPGDALERGQQWMELGDRGLHWQAHPTAVQNITNKHQRQPVFNSMIGGGPGPINLSVSNPLN